MTCFWWKYPNRTGAFWAAIEMTTEGDGRYTSCVLHAATTTQNLWLPRSVSSYLVLRMFSLSHLNHRIAQSQGSLVPVEGSAIMGGDPSVCRMQDWTPDGTDLISACFHALKKMGREIVLSFYVFCRLWKPIYSGSTRTNSVHLPSLGCRGLDRGEGGKKKTRWAQTDLPKSKQKRVHEPSKEKLVGALIISFQESLDIQEFPVGNILSQCRTLIFFKDSLEGLLHGLISGKFVTEAAKDGRGLSCGPERAHAELSCFADVRRVISCSPFSATWVTEGAGFFKIRSQFRSRWLRSVGSHVGLRVGFMDTMLQF